MNATSNNLALEFARQLDANKQKHKRFCKKKCSLRNI